MLDEALRRLINWLLYDVEHGKRAIGYEPQDYAEVPKEEWGR